MLPMVDRVAKDLRWMFARHLDLRDLTQAGTVGLVKAANAFEPGKASTAGFEPFAYFRVRGAIIDSQKRRTYREEANVSLQALASAHDGWLPPSLDTDGAPLPDELAEDAEIRRKLENAIQSLPKTEQTVLRSKLAGHPLATTARAVGRSMTWTRAKLQEAETMVSKKMRNE